MKYISAHYVFTSTAPPLKRAVICVEDDGTIIRVEDTGGNLPEKESLAFYNGIIVPGFVNCHCHLELSWMRNKIPAGEGLSNFLMAVTRLRAIPDKDLHLSIDNADYEMFIKGIILCADICNSSSTFDLKKTSRIKYVNLLEVFGTDLSKAKKRMDEIKQIAKKASEENLSWWIVPHSAYSISMPLFRLIKNETRSNKVTSIHFMESPDEKAFLANHSGPLMDWYEKFLPPHSQLDTPGDHLSAVMDEVTEHGNLILVHNTHIDRDMVRKLRSRKNLYYCLCPNSNKFISNTLPPAALLSEEGCSIVVGTDSLSSNYTLSILDELKTLQENLPSVSLDNLIRWATINGARALCEDSWAGSIEPGKKPGLILIENLDLADMRLISSSKVRRIL